MIQTADNTPLTAVAPSEQDTLVRLALAAERCAAALEILASEVRIAPGSIHANDPRVAPIDLTQTHKFAAPERPMSARDVLSAGAAKLVETPPHVHAFDHDAGTHFVCACGGRRPKVDLAHLGDPCIHCGVAHDAVAPGPCKALVAVQNAAETVAENLRAKPGDRSVEALIESGKTLTGRDAARVRAAIEAEAKNQVAGPSEPQAPTGDRTTPPGAPSQDAKTCAKCKQPSADLQRVTVVRSMSAKCAMAGEFDICPECRAKVSTKDQPPKPKTLTNVDLVGRILAAESDRAELESFGIKLGRFERDKSNPEGGEFHDCDVPVAAFEKLDPTWGRFVWSLEPKHTAHGAELDAAMRERQRIARGLPAPLAAKVAAMSDDEIADKDVALEIKHYASGLLTPDGFARARTALGVKPKALPTGLQLKRLAVEVLAAELDAREKTPAAAKGTGSPW